jgi:hypothetical protein
MKINIGAEYKKGSTKEDADLQFFKKRIAPE